MSDDVLTEFKQATELALAQLNEAITLLKQRTVDMGLVREQWLRKFESVADYAYTDNSGDELMLTAAVAADIVINAGITFGPEL